MKRKILYNACINITAIGMLFILLQIVGCVGAESNGVFVQNPVKKYYGAVTFISKPPGAMILNLASEVQLGFTPVMIIWENDSKDPMVIGIEFSKDGYSKGIMKDFIFTKYDNPEEAQKHSKKIMIQLEKK